VWPDFDEKLPVIERRDPALLPGARLAPRQKVAAASSTGSVHYTQLPPEYQAMLTDFVSTMPGP
jgi:hypothetical protein